MAIITLSYKPIKELVKRNEECRQTKMNKLLDKPILDYWQAGQPMGHAILQQFNQIYMSSGCDHYFLGAVGFVN